ncbi:uncharacterized protein LOC134267606 [Saccostrea cucullata]|uniref:uncharacterized protein LOC134267606 n=1 Tax=Saccostrea cuccullata TaxID=36930 RepID=UPI002ED17911
MGEEIRKMLRKKRSTAKGRFHRIYGLLLEKIQDEEESDIVKQMLSDLEQSYKDMEVRHSEYLENFDSDDENDKPKMDEANHDMNTLYKELCKARSLCLKLTTKKITSQEKCVKEQSLKVKKLDPPHFSGKIRNYPSFKSDYFTHMIPTYGKDPFALKNSLSGEPFEIIKGVDNDFEEMFKRLDLKYGRPEKLADTVLADIRALKAVPEGDSTKFTEMVEIVEGCWLILKRMGLEKEMDNATMISEIEKLLPSIQKREWALLKLRLKSTTFSDLLRFLLDERAAIEYMTSDIRESNNGSVSRKGKIHTITSSHEKNEKFDDSFVNVIQSQMQQNEQKMQQVIEGLAQVTDALLNGKQRGAIHDASRNDVSFRKKCWYHETDNHSIGDCTGFSALDGETKMELLKRNGACFSCLKSGHLSKRCNNRKPCEITDFRQQKCGRFHHPFLHGVIVNASAHHHSVNIVNEEQGKKGVILMISKIESGNIPLTTLWDPGANISLLTFESARKLGLKGREVTLSVTKVGNTSECIQSKEYLLPLTDMYGKVWQVKVYGRNKITADISKVDVHGVVKFFKGIKEGDIVRPEGKVDLLIGADCCILLPEKIDQIGNLQLMRNQFEYCIRGSHAKLRVPVTTESNLVCIHHTSGRIIEPIRLNHESLKNAVDNFFDIESLGTHCVPKCGSCRCGKCPPGNGSYTLKEERELHLIKEGLQYDEAGKNWTTTYPWIKDPKSLPNNINAAVCRLKCTERRLEKAGKEYSEAYGDQIADMVQRSVARKLTAEEMQTYEGPIHYIPHHEVLKPNSKTTPVRIVFDSSSSYMGHVLNDYWAKGPNVLNDLLGVIIRFRQRKIAIAGDITKMYNAIKLSERDQHTHRFVWRDLQIDRPPDHYVLMSVTFGDRPSGAISTMALRMTAEMNREEYPKAAEFVIKNSYVDDLLTSVNTVCEAKEIILNTERLLSCGGFNVKHWIVSGDQDDHFAGLNVLCAEQENILGMIWLPKDDVWMFKAKLNFSPKRRGKHTEDDIEDGQLHLIPDSLTRRTGCRHI